MRRGAVVAATTTMSNQICWFVARASGIVAWALLVASVVWGLFLAGRVARRFPPPSWTLDLHRFLGGLAVSFVAVHLVALVADNYVYFSWSELFVPLASRWRPWPVALGIVASYLLVAIEITSLLMRHLPRKLWRGVHLSSFGLAVLATVHGFTAGADAAHPAVRIGAVAAGALVVVMVVLRLTMPGVQARRRAQRQQSRQRQPRTAVEAAEAPSTV